MPSVLSRVAGTRPNRDGILPKTEVTQSQSGTSTSFISNVVISVIRICTAGGVHRSLCTTAVGRRSLYHAGDSHWSLCTVDGSHRSLSVHR